MRKLANIPNWPILPNLLKKKPTRIGKLWLQFPMTIEEALNGKGQQYVPGIPFL